MVTGTYLGSAVLTAALGVFLIQGNLTTWSFMAFVLAIFFLASAGASSAYLTVSEIFPMESRALSIAFFYAVGTAAGGIAGPLLFGHLINTGSQSKVAIGFFIGAAMMAVGGIAELFFGVKAEQKPARGHRRTADRDRRRGRGRGEAGGGGDEARRQPRGRVRGRYRPGPARYRGSPGMPVSHPYPAADLRREVEIIDRALHEGGTRKPSRAAAPGRRPLLGAGPLQRRPARGGGRGSRQAPARRRVRPGGRRR